jgi:hypothetical protein
MLTKVLNSTLNNLREGESTICIDIDFQKNNFFGSQQLKQ